jgi:hypothetical protein
MSDDTGALKEHMAEVAQTQELPKLFYPDHKLLRDLLGRIMTRNAKARVQRNAMRLAFLKNTEDLIHAPDSHLAVCVAVMDKRSQEGALPAFETGLLMGACMALCSGQRRGVQLLQKMLIDVETQQEGSTDEPEVKQQEDKKDG